MKFCFEFDLKKILFHLLFIIPLCFGYIYYSLALFGLVILFYVKVIKFDDYIKYGSLDDKDTEYYTKMRDRWKYLTFLK